jgi:hypothetical protein
MQQRKNADPRTDVHEIVRLGFSLADVDHVAEISQAAPKLLALPIRVVVGAIHDDGAWRSELRLVELRILHGGVADVAA